MSAARRSKPQVYLVTTAPDPAIEDHELVRGFIEGESKAAPAIWNRYAPMVYRLFDRALGPPKDSNDLTQEVFLRVFAGLHKLKDWNVLRSFIYSVAVRILKWEIRKRRVRGLLKLSDSGELPDHPVRGADSEARQALERFYQLMEALSANDRAAFVLRHMEGLTLHEIVEVTGVSLATVKRRVSRAAADVSRLIETDPDLSTYLDGASHAQK